MKDTHFYPLVDLFLIMTIRQEQRLESQHNSSHVFAHQIGRRNLSLRHVCKAILTQNSGLASIKRELTRLTRSRSDERVPCLDISVVRIASQPPRIWVNPSKKVAVDFGAPVPTKTGMYTSVAAVDVGVVCCSEDALAPSKPWKIFIRP